MSGRPRTRNSVSGASPHTFSSGHDTPGGLRRVPGPGADVVVGQQREGGDDVLAEVLVLVVADDEQRIGREGL